MDRQILSQKTEETLFRNTFLPRLLTGECLTTIWIPHAGRRKTLVYLTQNANRFGFQKLGKFRILYIDHSELAGEAPEDYYRLLLKNLNYQPKVAKLNREDFFHLLKNKVIKEVHAGFRLIFILDHFDLLDFPTYFYNNLANLHEINKTKINFIFVIAKNILTPPCLKNYGQLTEMLCQNLIYIPLLNEIDAQIAVRNINQKYRYQLSTKKQDLIAQISGGHPALIKAGLSFLAKNPHVEDQELIEALAQHQEVQIILRDIWENLADEDREFLIALANQSSVRQKVPQHLLKLRLVKTERQQTSLFTPLLLPLIKNQSQKTKTLTFDKKRAAILLDQQPIKEKITLQEYHLLAAFLNEPNQILSRDKIADILWDKDSYDKYSDWSIDQIISQLRKKLESAGVSSKNIQTIRNRGYRWLAE